MRRRSRVPTVKKAVNESARRLRGAARPAVARQSLKYFKPGDSIYVCGVKTPEVRKFARELYRSVEGGWGIGDALEFCDSMVGRRELESKALGFFLLSHFRDEFRSDLLRHAERWVAADLCENWAAVDTLCGAITSPVLERNPRAVMSLRRMARSRNMWVRRTAVVTFVPLARAGMYLDEAYDIVVPLFGNSEDLMHKALGWLLREAGKTDMERLERFLARYGHGMPRTTVRYAIERFPEAARKKLLTDTRGG